MDKFINEPNLMYQQTEPFNGDTFVAKEFLKLKEKFGIKNAVELGSCVGGTTKWLGENFPNVWTIEINPTFRDICIKRTEGLTNIVSILGSTVDMLGGVLDLCNENGYNTIVFVDSHWLSHFPLVEELQIINVSSTKPCLVIHDCYVPNEPALGYDSYNGVTISYETMKPYLDEIYGEGKYSYHYNSDKESTAVKRGVIFIYPNA